MKDCSELYKMGIKTPGTYTVDPTGNRSNFTQALVNCDEDGWTNIMVRGDYWDPEDNFYRDTWNYKEGFGSLDKEHWLGLDKIYELTKNGDYEMRLRMTDWDDVTKEVFYATFRIIDQTTYGLTATGFYPAHHSEGLFDAFGLSADGATGFTTFNDDHDNWAVGNCAVQLQGAGWFSK